MDLAAIKAKALALFAALTRRFEGRRKKPYLCPAGVPTIGEGSTHYEDGAPVKMADPPIDDARIDALADRDRRAFLLEALKASPGLAKEPGALAAVSDFIYNMGPTRYRASTFRRKVNEGNWPAARQELPKWVWGGGKKLPGLITRRAAEAALLPDS